MIDHEALRGVNAVHNNEGTYKLLSDGYHTFDELYKQRMIMLVAILNSETYAPYAWKSTEHHPDENFPMYTGMFIVGISHPAFGQMTWHIDAGCQNVLKNWHSNWYLFHCQELAHAPRYDGHSPKDAISRLSMLATSTCSACGSNVVSISGMCRACEAEFVKCNAFTQFNEKITKHSGLVTLDNILRETRRRGIKVN